MSSKLPADAPQAAYENVKIWFKFVPREGWPPIDEEGLWAAPVTGDTARIVNVALFQDGVAEGDVIRYVTDANGVHWATERVEASGNVTIRLLPIPSGPLGRDAKAVHERLSVFGLGGESFTVEFPLVAVTVPHDAPMSAIKELLARGADDGWWYWENGCSTEAWDRA